MLFKKILIIFIIFVFSGNAFANTPRSTGKYKNWESFVAETDKGKICFAQTVPTKRAPAAIKRDKSKLFVTFRPTEDIKDEVSITSGHDYKSSTVTARSGKRKYSFFSQKSFAWWSEVMCFDENHYPDYRPGYKDYNRMYEILWQESAKITDFATRKGLTFRPYNTNEFAQWEGFDRSDAFELDYKKINNTKHNDVYITSVQIPTRNNVHALTI